VKGTQPTGCALSTRHRRSWIGSRASSGAGDSSKPAHARIPAFPCPDRDGRCASGASPGIRGPGGSGSQLADTAPKKRGFWSRVFRTGHKD
jgi:hypothetical protein